MTKRDRNHELETESQRAFEGALPPSLVVREVSDDYGIDREVEVFQGGRTTGLTFKVQLKGTDKSGITRRVKRTSLDYWASLDVPVLIVSYESQTGVLRGRWVHSIGADQPDRGAATVTVTMDPEIDIAGNWPASLVDDLSDLRALRHGEVVVPTPVRVTTVGDAVIDAQHLLAALLNTSRRTTSRMRSAVDDREAALAVLVDGSRLQVSLPLRVASTTMRLENRGSWGNEPRLLADTVLLLAACTVGTVNEVVARAWLSGVHSASPGWAGEQLAGRLVRLLDAPECATVLFEVHAQLVAENSPTADIYLPPTIRYATSLSAKDFERYAARIREVVAADPDDAARRAFNLAGLHRNRNEHQEAVELFDMARSLEPHYASDPILHRARGGSLWDLGRYDESAAAYRHALGLGYDAHEIRPLLADSLIHAGRYAEAQEVLQEWQPRGKESDRLGLLRQEALREIVDVLGITQQDRSGYDVRGIEAKYRRAKRTKDLTRSNLEGLLRESDALHPIPWMHLASMERDERGYGPAMVLAIRWGHRPEVWVAALMQALAHKADDSLIRAIVDQARFESGDDFYDAVWEVAGLHDSAEADYLRSIVSAAYSAEPDVLLHHLRLVDVTADKFVIDSVRFPEVAIRGHERLD